MSIGKKTVSYICLAGLAAAFSGVYAALPGETMPPATEHQAETLNLDEQHNVRSSQQVEQYGHDDGTATATQHQRETLEQPPA